MSVIEPRRLRIAMVGTRGVPAAYGGFETAIEEIGQRLAARGHDVTVYCRSANRARPRTHLGMTLVHLPALKTKSIETLSHTALSAIHLAIGKRQDAAFVFNAANAPFVPLIRSRGTATAVHVDGLEWKRGKWGRMGKRYYRVAEQMAVKNADALISDAQGIADYYDHEFGIPTELLTYGANILRDPASDRLAELGLEPGQYHLVVARFEPENHVDVIVDGYTASGATQPLGVVGAAPYSAAYTDRIDQVAAADPRIQRLGGVWDQEQLDQLYAHALTTSTATRSAARTRRCCAPWAPRPRRSRTTTSSTATCSARTAASGRTPPVSPRSARARRPRPTRPSRSAAACRSAPRRRTTGTPSPTATRSSRPA